MVDIFRLFGFEQTLANAGVKMPLGADPEEYIQLRMIPNPEYRAMLTKEYRAVELAMVNADTTVQNKIGDEVMAKVLANTSVTGWGKKVGLNGTAIKFSAEKCTQLFIDFPALRQKCQAFAEDNKNYQFTPEVSVDEVKKS